MALKAVRPGPAPLAEARRECLVREAQAAAPLSHPNIVTLYQIGSSEWGPYLVLEMLHGETLKEHLARGALPPAFHALRAHYLVGDGDAGFVWKEAQELLARDPNAAAAHATSLAYLGDLEHASELAVHLRPGSPRQQTYQAVVLWQRGERGEALRRLREIAAGSSFDADFALAPAYLYGDLAARSGADAEAVAALRDFQSLFIPAMMWRSWAYPRSLYLEAASLERLGRPAEAMEQVDRLLGQWKGADSGQPLLRDARALRARLAAALEPARRAAR